MALQLTLLTHILNGSYIGKEEKETCKLLVVHVLEENDQFVRGIFHLGDHLPILCIKDTNTMVLDIFPLDFPEVLYNDDLILVKPAANLMANWYGHALRTEKSQRCLVQLCLGHRLFHILRLLR